MPRDPGIDPILHMIPADQLDRVLGSDMCDIDSSFLGFTEIYLALAQIIPLHWTIVDLGCAFAPQAFAFQEHKAYIGVDRHDGERFIAPNTTHHVMSTGEFIASHMGGLDLEQTFAICSYVPPWGEESRELTRRAFRNVFTYYPRGGPDIETYLDLAKIRKAALQNEMGRRGFIAPSHK